MKQSRVTCLYLLLVFIVGSIQPLSLAKAQSPTQFEGQIAFVDMDGNVTIIRGGGYQKRITSDANIAIQIDAGGFYSTDASKNGEDEIIQYHRLRFSSNGKYLAFCKEQDTVSSKGFAVNQIYLYSIESEQLSLVRNSDSWGCNYEWLNNSQRIIFGTDQPSERGTKIFKAGIDGISEFIQNIQAIRYSVSPDGSKLIFGNMEEPYNWEIIDLASKNNLPVDVNMDVDSFSWSSDSQWVFAVKSENVNTKPWGQLISWNATTGIIYRWNLYIASAMESWSPDSTRIAVGSSFPMGNDPTGLWIVEPSGNNPELVYDPGSNRGVSPYWSQNSNYIALVETDMNVGFHDLSVFNLKTRSATFIASKVDTVKWAPSGDYLLYGQESKDFFKDQSNRMFIIRDLMIYDVATNTKIKIADASQTNRGFAQKWDWAPLPSSIEIPPATSTPSVSDTPLPSTIPELPPSSTCSNASHVQPIMLVVGWGGSEGSPGLAKETNEFAVYTREFFAKHGYVPECNIFYATGTSPNKTQKENAREIQRSLCAAYDAVKEYRSDWNGHFDIIGHSYGGLRSRAYLENDSLYGYCTANGVTERVIKVDNLFTLGSPHGGEPLHFDILPLAMLILSGDISGQLDKDKFPISAAAAELLPPVRAVVNKTSWQPKGVNYHLIIGNVTKDSVEYAKTTAFWMFLGEPDANYSPGEVYDHDLAVHEESSLILSTINLKYRYPLMRTVVTQDWHGWDPIPRAKAPSFSPPTYYSDSETLLRHVLPYIGRTETPSGGGGGGSWMVLPVNMQNKVMANATPISIAQQEAQEYAPQLNIHIGDGVLNPGRSQQIEFTVSQAESMEITLITGNKDLQLNLIQPDGQSITKDTVGIQFQELALEGNNLKGYQITNMLAGKWIVIVDGIASTEDASFVVSATPSTPIVLQPILPEWRPNQNTVEISTKVSIENAPVTGGNLLALIIRPDGSTQSLDLFDDGAHQDGGANDGVYGNTFSQTDIGGVYRTFFTATGSFINQTFIRNAIAYFIIAPSTAKLIDPFSDSGIDENNDGSYEYLEIQMPLTVNQAGNYVISGDLYAGDTFIAPAAIHQSFQPGSQTVKLRFDGATIFASQKDGAYTVRNILFLDETEIPLLIEEKSPYTTSAYSYMDFSSKNFSLPNITSSTTLLVAGGLGLLCLTVLAIGGVFVYTRTRKPKYAPAKSVSRPQAVKPVSGSAEQIKKAIELSKSKRHEEAFEILRGIVQAEPNNMSAWFNLGGVLAEMGNYKDAEQCYARAKQLGHPRGDDALNWLRQHRK